MLERNIQIIFRVNKAEYQYLKKQIKGTGYSQAAYLRSLIMGYVPRELPPADYHSMIKELRAIGNRMNRIAAREHTGTPATATKHFNTVLFMDNKTVLQEVLFAFKTHSSHKT
ncbi:MAG: plasmid mobilization relaxosome protein MobC [Clostridia bacterium]